MANQEKVLECLDGREMTLNELLNSTSIPEVILIADLDDLVVKGKIAKKDSVTDTIPQRFGKPGVSLPSIKLRG